MSDTAQFLELDITSGSPPTSEQVFKDEDRIGDKHVECDLAAYDQAAALKGVSPVDALIRI
jgi:hypothetical protein